jgi:UDP-glucose 6-dehydrogenase
MGIFTQDEHLNLSAAYLRPGGPYGGPCLPKDVAALTELARPVGTPLLNAIAWSNRAQLQQLIERALATGGQRYGVLGLSFKAGTSDLRASPAREIIAALQAEGREVRVYDPDVPPGLAGEYAPLLQAWDEIATWAETWVVCKPQLARRHVLHGEVVGWTPSTYAGCV